MNDKYKILLDETAEQEVRYISFMGNFHRYDFAIFNAREDNKKIVIDLRKNRFAMLTKNDLTEEGVIEHEFHVTEIEADELREFLKGALYY
ncbi:SAV0927 family protein [Virgibacillus flavescens]|uniref:SAV0927 family protein n=1 Tax=Virgibacillus flavescens TaxID=1611422 RepID=UPI003D34AF55